MGSVVDLKGEGSSDWLEILVEVGWLGGNDVRVWGGGRGGRVGRFMGIDIEIELGTRTVVWGTPRADCARDILAFTPDLISSSRCSILNASVTLFCQFGPEIYNRQTSI